MTQNREPPAYQEYAASILAHLHFRIMTMQDRGLFYTLRLECWVNRRLPQHHNELAKILGLPVSEVAGSLAAVMFFFEVVDGFIICPELENYRTHLADRRDKQSQGGKLGSKITNTNRKKKEQPDADNESSISSTNSQPTCQGACDSLVTSSSEEQSQDQSLEGEPMPDSFIADYKAEEKRLANAYSKASRGE